MEMAQNLQRLHLHAHLSAFYNSAAFKGLQK